MKVFISIFFSLFLFSCFSMNGKIIFEGGDWGEIHDSKQAILVNTSTTKLYQFTVKTTSSDGTSTSTYQLFPGEQAKLGCTFSLEEVNSQSDEIVQDTMAVVYDTTISTLNTDTKIETSRLIRMNYEVVGEMELKQKDKPSFDNSLHRRRL